MKKCFFSLFVILMTCGVFTAFADEYERVYEHLYSVDNDADLLIDNRYGDIVINTWEKNEVKIIVTISCETNREEKAEKFFDHIDIDFDGKESAVSAKTHLRIRNSRVKEFSIDYNVFAPASMAYYIQNKFGDIFLPDLGGSLSLELSYGEFSIGRLLNDENYLDINYSEGKVLSIEGGSLEVDYCELEIEEIGQIRLDSDFSDVSIRKGGILNVETSYDELDFGEIDELDIESKFSEVDVNLLNTRMNANCNYGELAVERTKVSAEEVFISGKFTDIMVGLNAAISWKFLANTEYTDIRFSDPVDYVDESEENFYKRIYSGILWEKKSPSATFTLEAKNCEIDIVKF